jgi:glycosyltransferase involved in cell wall biosynthesis
MLRLLVVIPDRISEILQKGEYSARYYNPGEIFDEVHILMTNDDKPDLGALQKTVGRARLFLHNSRAGKGLFLKSVLWRPPLLKKWAREGVSIAARIKPNLIRCHGNHLNAFLASEIKRELGVPYVLSMHINPDEDIRKRAHSWVEMLASRASVDMEKIAINNADLVLPVYKPILPYLRRLGATKIELIYNVINPAHLRKKENYDLHDPVQIISVGRVFREKYPINLIKALKGFNVELTVIGDGPRLSDLQRDTAEAGMTGTVRFIPAIPNDRLCELLPGFDIFATHSEYFEVSKSVLEPLLTGLPVVLNKRIGEPVPEFLEGDFLLLVENSVEGYSTATEQLITDHAFRENLGRKAYEHAWTHWSPAKMEAKYAEVYRRVMEGAGEQL